MTVKKNPSIQEQLLDQRRDEMIAMIGHELRTPLTSIKGFTELLEKRAKTLKDQKILDYAFLMHIQTERLIQLVRDIMDTSKIRTGKLVLSKVPFDLNGLLTETVKSLQPLTKKHTIARKTSGRLVIFADRGRINQVITNLLTNAIKYSPGKSKIIVTIRQTDDKVIVSVQDFGIGINPNQKERIFDPFYQGSNRLELGRGLGPGLYISSQIVRLHHGRIWVESVVGKGSTFYFSLPL